MKKVLVAALVLFLSMQVLVFGQHIKIASIAPEASPWGLGLNKLAAEWSRISNGQVRVSIFHGGIAGDEANAIRKMRLGQIQGVLTTPVGIGGIYPDIWGLAFPGFLRNSLELDHVLTSHAAELNESLRAEGVEVLAWSNIGFLYFFSRQELHSPRNIQNIRIAATDLPDSFLSVIREIGMQPVSISVNEILTSLNSGLVNTLIAIPLAVAGNQWFAVANTMADFPISPVFGAVILDSRVWQRIPQEFHAPFKEVAQEIVAEIDENLHELENTAIAEMRRFGLKNVSISESEKMEWHSAFDKAREQLNNQFYNNATMRAIQATIEEHRRSQ